MEMRLETISPAKAREYLKRNTTNRPLRQNHIDRMVLTIQNKEWVLNGETIKFDKEGNLRDGQHRLHAIVVSGIPCQAYVLRGIDASAFDTIDQGKCRNLNDILAIAHEKHYSTTAAALRWLYAFETGVGYNRVITMKTNRGFHEYLGDNQDLRYSVEFVRSLYTGEISASVGMFCALHCVFFRKHGDKANQFMERVLGGEGLHKDMPEYKIRSILLKRATETKKLPLELVCNLVIKAWNATFAGNEVKTLRSYPDESRPAIK